MESQECLIAPIAIMSLFGKMTKKTKPFSNQQIDNHEPMPLGFKILFGMIAGLILIVIFGYLFLLTLFDKVWG